MKPVITCNKINIDINNDNNPFVADQSITLDVRSIFGLMNIPGDS